MKIMKPYTPKEPLHRLQIDQYRGVDWTSEVPIEVQKLCKKYNYIDALTASIRHRNTGYVYGYFISCSWPLYHEFPGDKQIEDLFYGLKGLELVCIQYIDRKFLFPLLRKIYNNLAPETYKYDYVWLKTDNIDVLKLIKHLGFAEIKGHEGYYIKHLNRRTII